MIIKARIGSGRFVGAITSIFTELEPSQFSKVKIPTILSYFPSLCECLFSFVNSWAVTWSRLNSYLDKKCFRFFFWKLGLNFRNSRENNGNFFKLVKLKKNSITFLENCIVFETIFSTHENEKSEKVTESFSRKIKLFALCQLRTFDLSSSLCECLSSFFDSWAVTWVWSHILTKIAFDFFSEN